MKKVLLIVLICITHSTVAQKLTIASPIKFLALGDSLYNWRKCSPKMNAGRFNWLMNFE